MTKVTKGARFISKITEVTGVEPTIPPNDDHTLGWRDTDIYIGEWFFNVQDSKIYFRDNNGISQIVTPDPATGQIDPALLPGNYIGAMVYRGVWDARTVGEGGSGQPPGVAYGRLVPEKGDYYVVSVAGSQNLDGETDWKVGDYPIYNGTQWDKIDNSEPIIYANNVLYDNSTYTSLTNVDEALEKIFDEKFITPSFDSTVTIEDSTLTTNYTFLQLNGNSTDKWINWDGTTLKMGSNDDSNSILKVGPKSTTGAAKTSRFEVHWLSGAGDQMLRWKINATNTVGHLEGWDDTGTSIRTRISSTDDNYFLDNNVGIGIGTPTSKLHVRSTGALYTGTPSLRVSDSSNRATVFIESEIDQPTDLIFRNNNRLSWTMTTRNSASNYALQFFPSTNGTSWGPVAATLITSGEMGIGVIPTPGYKLDVGGNIRSSSQISSATASISGLLSAGSISTSGTLAAGNTTITGNITNVTGISQFTGKAKYANYATVTINDLDDIPHKNYVDDEILAHAVGWWRSGTTQTPTLKDVVVWNSTHTYKVGINKLDPTYDLDVVGNALISSTLDVTGQLNANSDMTIGGAILGGLDVEAGYTPEMSIAYNEIKIGDYTYLNNGSYLRLDSNTSDQPYMRYYGDTGAIVFTAYGYGANKGLDVDGKLDVANAVNLGSANTDKILLRGTTVEIANYATSAPSNLNFAFTASSAFGDFAMGVQTRTHSSPPQHLRIQGQDNTYNGTTAYGGNLTIRGGNSTYENGGALNLYGGTGGTGTLDKGGNVVLEAGSGYDGGHVVIRGGESATSDGGNITIQAGEMTGSGSAGELYIKEGLRTSGGFQGQIFIDHAMNKVYEYSYSFTGDYTTETVDEIMPSTYNFSNIILNADNDYASNYINIYLGILEMSAGYDLFHIFHLVSDGSGGGGSVSNYINIRKGSSGTTNIVSWSTGGTGTYYATVMLSWNHAQSKWSVLSTVSTGGTITGGTNIV